MGSSRKRKRKKVPAPPAPVPEGQARPRGQQSVRTRALEDEMIAFVSDGGNLRTWCEQDGHPSWQSIYEWLGDDGLGRRFARARELWCQAHALEALRIADTQVSAEREEIDDADSKDRKRRIVREDAIGHRKLRIETRLKLIARIDPKHWADKLKLAGDKDEPLLGVDEVADRVQAILERAATRKPRKREEGDDAE